MRSTDSMDSTLSDRKKLALFDAISDKGWLVKLSENEELSDHLDTLAQLTNTARDHHGVIEDVLEHIEMRRQFMLNSLQELFATSRP